MEESRKQFEYEAAVKEKFGDLIDRRLCKNGDGEYFAWDMQVAWWAWQASRSAVEIELPDMNSKRYVEHGTDFDFLQYRIDLEDAIRAAGLRVKEK